MKKPSEDSTERDALYEKIIGLGEKSLRKSHYPELLQRIDELREANDGLRREVAERRRAEDALRESESRLRESQRMARVGNWYWDIQTGDVEWSEQVYRIFRLDPREFTPRIDSILALSPWPEDHERDQELIRRAMESGEQGSYEQRFLRPDGSIGYYYSTFQGLYGDDGALVAIRGTVQDITERKQAEAALRESQAKLEQAQLIARVGDFTWDIATGAVSWSAGMCDLLGYDGDEVIDINTVHDKVHHPDDLERVTKWLSDSIASGVRSLGPNEYRLVRKDGEVIEVQTNGRIEYEDGKAVRMFGTCLDITDRKHAERERRAHLHFLESLDRINRVIQQEDDPEQMLWGVVHAVFEIFGCDRAWLLYPCDPEAPECRVPVEATRPEYPGANEMQTRIMMNGGPAEFCARTLASDVPVAYGVGGDYPIDETDQERLNGAKSLLALAVRPKVGKPWMFGLHQCSHPRVWTPEERRLFAEIGRRIGDALSTRLIFRDLRTSEERMELALHGADLGTWDWNVTTGEVVFNKRCAEMLGYAEDEITPRVDAWEKLIHPDDLPDVLAAINAHLEGRTDHYETEHRLHHKAGRWVWVLDKGRVIERDGDGKPLRACGTHLDITERKRAEQVARESGERLRLAMQAAHMGTWEWDVLGNRMSWSPETLGIFGISAEEFGETYEAYLELAAPEGREDVDKRVREFLASARKSSVIQYEHKIVRGDGAVGWVEVRGALFLDNQDRPARMAGVCTDITERTRAEEALQLTRFSIDSLSVGVFCVSNDGRIQSVNKHACKSLGYTADELCGMSIFDIDPTFDSTRWREHRARLDEAGSVWFESIHQRMDGAKFPVEVTINRSAIGGRQFSIWIIADVTQRKRAEEERRDLEAQLRQSQKLEAVGQLAGGVAHDFNNLLTAILGNVELSIDTVRRALGADHSVVRSIEQIEKAAQRASTLTRQLLTFSRRGVVQPRSLDVNTILRGLDPMLRRLISESITLEMMQDPRLDWVRADAGQLEQVIVNLVVNAGQAMPDGGRLTLETKNVMLDEDYTRRHADARPGPHVMLAVSDTGHGMDAATLERIFEPFFTTKPSDQGTGLGLATVHGIVKQSGGHVMAYSEVGRGTTFKVYLPTTDVVHDEPAPQARPDRYERGHETILLCEDDSPVRELIAQSLRASGYTVISAGTGREGLEAAEGHNGHIDLLITDVIMPDMNGRALSERLIAVRPGVATLFISGYTSNVIAHHGVLNDGVEFLEKPFTRQGLLTKVREVLARARSDA